MHSWRIENVILGSAFTTLHHVHYVDVVKIDSEKIQPIQNDVILEAPDANVNHYLLIQFHYTYSLVCFARLTGAQKFRVGNMFINAP